MDKRRPKSLSLRRFAHYARAAGAAATVTGSLVLLGWLFDVSLFKSVLPGKIAMKPNTAVCLVLLGAALLLLVLAPSQHVVRATRRRVAVACATMAAVTGLVTLFEYGFGVDLGIDRLFFRGSLLAKGDPGRMAASTALGFVLLGCSLLLLDARHKLGRLCSELFALVNLVIGLVALLGYFYGIESLYGVFAYTPIAVHTAFLLAVLSLGVLVSRPASGLASVITSERGGGVMARRIMPLAVSLLVALGWMRLKGGLSLFVAGSIVVLASWIWLSARSLNALEEQREEVLEALRQSQSQFAGVIDSALDGIITIDDAQRVVLFNKAAEEMFRCTAAEAIGQSLDRFIPLRFRARHGKDIRKFGETGDTTRTMTAARAVSGLRADGKEFPMEASISQLEVGSRKLYTVIMRDITEKRRSEKAMQASELRYRRLFESAKDGILILDADSGQIADVNPYLIEMLGYSKEDFMGKELWDIGFFKDVVDSKAAFVELQAKGYIRYDDLPLKTRAGFVRQVEFVSNSYRVNGGRVIQCNIRDITERKLAEVELIAANQRLEQALAELQAKRDELAGMTQQLWQASKLATMGELAASIAHELNNPLATVGLRTESLLMQMPEDPEKRKPLEIIAQEVDRMASLVNNLLQFSRRSHRQVSTVEPHEEIATSVEFVHYHLRSHNIEVVREFSDGLPSIQADRQQLRQLFLNLLTNASDAMPQGGKLTLRAVSNQLGDGKAVAIEVEDTGEGITAENLEKIWEPFFTTKPEGKGTGLGLAICRRIVEEHGGTISIQSEGAGRGATVRIVLPATTKGVLE
jgi:PAS domain S-box-containing protein